MKAHPLTKLQLVFGILWGVHSCISTNAKDPEHDFMFFLGIFLFLAVSVITFYLGWLMVIRKEIVTYPYEILVIRLVKHFRGEHAAEKLSSYVEPSRMILIGKLNLFSGALCSVVPIAWIIVVILDML